MIMSRHGSLGFGRGLALGAGSEHSYSGLGIGSDPERERENQKSVGENVQELTHHHHPQHGVQAQFWLKCLKSLESKFKGNDVERPYSLL